MNIVPNWVIEEFEDHIKQLEAELEMFRNGYKGGCYACEPVALLNQKLEAELEAANKKIADMPHGSDCTSEYCRICRRSRESRQCYNTGHSFVEGKCDCWKATPEEG